MGKRLAQSVVTVLVAALIFIAGWEMGQRSYKQELRKSAGLDSAVLQELQQMDSLHRAQAQLYAVKWQQEVQAREVTEQLYADSLKRLRQKPPRYVKVPEVKMLECDSAIASGLSYRLQAEYQQMEIIELRELVAVGDSANDYLGDIVLLQEERHREDQAEVKEAKEKLVRQKKWTKVWRSVAITTGAVATVLVIAVTR